VHQVSEAGGDPFAGKAEWFDRGYRESTHGRVRLDLVLERLLPALPPPPARVLDAGGGTGAFAIPLAALGYRVTVLDLNGEWLAVAERAATASGVDLSLVQGKAEEAPSMVEGLFDAVLCHTVLIYAAEPDRTLRALRDVARPGAVLSSLEKNRDALAVRPSKQEDFAEALRVMDDPVASGRLGIPNRSLTVGELRALMLRTGWLPERWGGIRVYADGVIEAVDDRTFDTIMELERRASVREPHRRFGRFLHVLARAWEPEPLAAIQERSFDGVAEGTRESWPPERSLGAEALWAFLERKRYAILSTTRPDGRPHSAMVAFCLRDDRLWLPAVAGARRTRNLHREPSAALLVTDGEGDEHVAVLVEGQAAVHDDPRPLLDSWLRDAWRDRHGTELDWAGAIIELIPTKALSYSAR
jgi:S-adenosylmethionine-dependent methyltransferase